MVKKGGEVTGDINLGTDNWNVADGYTKLKILRQLVLLDRYDTLAQFGTEDIGEDLDLNENEIKKKRVEALQRFHSTLKQLVGNVYFAIRKNDRNILDGLKIRLKNLDQFVGGCYESTQDKVDYNEIFTIHEEQFGKILDILQEIKDELNTPLNNANLIFRASEEVDLDKIMQGIVDGG